MKPAAAPSPPDGVAEPIQEATFDTCMQQFYVALAEQQFPTLAENLGRLQHLALAEADPQELEVRREIVKDCETKTISLAEELMKKYAAEGNEDEMEFMLSDTAPLGIVAQCVAVTYTQVQKSRFQAMAADAVKQLVSLRQLSSMTCGGTVEGTDPQPYATAITQILHMASTRIHFMCRLQHELMNPQAGQAQQQQDQQPPSLSVQFGVNLEGSEMAQFDKCSCTQVQRVIQMFCEDRKLRKWETRAMEHSMPPPPVADGGGPPPRAPSLVTEEDVRLLDELLDELHTIIMWCERYTHLVSALQYEEPAERTALVKQLQFLVGSYVLLEKLLLGQNVRRAVTDADPYMLSDETYISSMVQDCFMVVQTAFGRAARTTNVQAACATARSVLDILDPDAEPLEDDEDQDLGAGLVAAGGGGGGGGGQAGDSGAFSAELKGSRHYRSLLQGVRLSTYAAGRQEREKASGGGGGGGSGGGDGGGGSSAGGTPHSGGGGAEQVNLDSLMDAIDATVEDGLQAASGDMPLQNAVLKVNCIETSCQYTASLAAIMGSCFAQLPSAASQQGLIAMTVEDLDGLVKVGYEAMRDSVLGSFVDIFAAPPLLETMRAQLDAPPAQGGTHYEPQLEEFNKWQIQDPLVQRVVAVAKTSHALDAARRSMTATGKRMVLEGLAERVAEHLEKGVMCKCFNELGALVLQSQVRHLLEALQSLAPAAEPCSLRQQFARLNHIALILGFERPSDVHDYQIPLTVNEISNVMFLRPEFLEKMEQVEQAMKRLEENNKRRMQQKFGV